jgi:hypothetical protein
VLLLQESVVHGLLSLHEGSGVVVHPVLGVQEVVKHLLDGAHCFVV